jgi:hypothetical protein
MYSIWLRKFFLTTVLVLMIILIGFSGTFDRPVLGLHKSVYLIALGIVYLVIITINQLLRPDYVFFNDAADKIVLRYYPIRLINQKKYSIEIHKNRFVKYETEKFFFGLKERLFVYQKTPQGIAKYPGISLSAVDKKDIQRIKNSLEQWGKMY